MLSIQNFSEMFRQRRQKRSKHSSTPHIWFSNWNMISNCWMSSRVDLKMDLLCSLCSHTYEILQTWLLGWLIVVAQILCYAAFHLPKVGKKSKGCECAAQNLPKIWSAIPKNHIHPFPDFYIVNCFLNLSIGEVLVGGVGCGCYNTVILNSARGVLPIT